MIVVTGGAGFIGSNLVRGLNDESEKDILIVDNLKNSEKHKNLNSLEFADYMDKLDFVRSLNHLNKLKIDCIFLQGACSDTMEQDGKYMMENNYEYSKLVLHFCLENRIPFIYASSASVYGDGKKGFKEERSCEYPLNIYAFSKYLFDQYVRKIIHRSRSQIIGLRYFNVYGPQENHKGRMASVVYHFYNEIMKESRIRLFEGSADFLRDFIFVKDIVDINLFFRKNPSKKGIFNCGTGQAESFLKIAEIMEGSFPGSKIEFIPFPEELKGKYQGYTRADLAQLRNAGYSKEFTSLEKGVAAYAEILRKSGGYLMPG